MSARAVIAFFATLAFCASALAQADPRERLLRVIRYGEVSRAQLKRDCLNNPLYSSMERLAALCAKRDRIPLEVAEDAAAPFLKARMSTDLAEAALRFWESDIGRSLSEKIIREIETGKYDQLSEAERQLTKVQDMTDYGVVLSSMAKDKEAGRAVARALFAYEPEAPARPATAPRRR